MNELHSDLKRLLKWARQASRARPEEAPFGFSGRVLASRRPAQAATLLQELHRTAWALTCGSLALIVCCVLVWISQRPAPPPTEKFTSALSFLASNLPR